MKEVKLNLQNGKNKNGLIPLTWENIIKHEVLTKSKVQWLTEDVEKTVVISGKLTGKTFPVKILEALEMVNNPALSTYDFRKHQNKAAFALGGYMSAAITTLVNKGFDLGGGWKKTSQGYFHTIINKREMYKNPSQTYASLEGLDAISGGAANNGGFYGIVHIDEPVIIDDMDDPEKIPDSDEWKFQQGVIKSNLRRHYVTYKNNYPTKPSMYKLFITMNPWGNHPEVLEAEEIFPEKLMTDYIFGEDVLDDLLGDPEATVEWFDDDDNIKRLFTNNTMVKFSEDKRVQYVRLTIFSNPTYASDEEEISEMIMLMKDAIALGNKKGLAEHLGLKFSPDENENMLVYSVKDFNNKSREDFEKEGFLPERITYSVDKDVNRVFTITPGIRYEKVTPTSTGLMLKQEAVLIDKQIEVQAYGSGAAGEMNDIYIENVAKEITEHRKSMKNKPKFTILAVDDDQKTYLNEIMKTNISSFVDVPRSFIKRGDNTQDGKPSFDIEARQAYTKLGFDKKAWYNHPDNELLENDFNVCIKADIKKPQRKTTGTTNYLDRIDSFEQVMFDNLDLIWKSER